MLAARRRRLFVAGAGLLVAALYGRPLGAEAPAPGRPAAPQNKVADPRPEPGADVAKRIAALEVRAEEAETTALRRHAQLAAIEAELRRAAGRQTALHWALGGAIALFGVVVSLLLAAGARTRRGTEELRSKVSADLDVKTQELHRVASALADTTAELERLQTSDPLTGLANRRRFEETLDLEWRRAFRLRTPLSLLLIDVDAFKTYKETYGHVQGDECLKAIGEVISQSARRPGDLGCRYGGEEFSVLLAGTDEEDAQRVAEKVRMGVEALGMPHGGSSVTSVVTVSVGAATLHRGAEADIGKLFSAAEDALRRAKEAGRNQVALATAAAQTA